MSWPPPGSAPGYHSVALWIRRRPGAMVPCGRRSLAFLDKNGARIEAPHHNPN